ncbi:hypothetical protein [Amycolatopsis sp. YIM 10]|uniref:hypothetical protein n=1 Tax=Amycolatopsis sp. YIM 10 TaxID=2653857 RepID=UPI0012A9F900|nr:hypothetical protein [Amycolatopsis sp. YIM 10]QFU87397.1 hypothetical protein YIM_10975 [Amycolatopsis sp. YIM 10]
MSRMFSRLRRPAAVMAMAAAVFSAGVLAAAPASAATLKVRYPVTGESVVKKTGSPLALGPGTLDTTVTTKPGGGDISGVLSIPPAKASFQVFGFIPVKATVTVIPTGPVTGEIKQGVITTHADAYIQLSDIWVAGIFYTPVGNECKTQNPVGMDLKSEGDFTIFNGGTVSGSYTIPEFKNCTIFAPLLSSLVSGPDNTIKLLLGKASSLP